MINPVKVANDVADALNLRLVPDDETASFYMVKHGQVPSLGHDLNFNKDFFANSYPRHSYNALAFSSARDTIPGLLAKTWQILTTQFPGIFHKTAYMAGLGRVAIFIHNDVIFFMYGMEIVYVARDKITYSVID